MIDWETRGLDTSLPEFRPVGLGICWGTYALYLDLSDEAQDWRTLVLLLRRWKLVAHNVLFDAQVLRWAERRAGLTSIWNWEGCTLALYQQMANEGWPGQRWGLKSAMKDLLGWSETNEKELDAWLVEHGYHSKIKKAPDKSEMWRAPQDILGHYCLLDVWATWLLWDRVLLPAAKKFPVSLRYHKEDTLELFRLLVDQQERGILINVARLQKYKEELTAKIQKGTADWLARPEVAPHVEVWERKQFEVLASKEPPRRTQKGVESIRWQKWVAKYQRLIDEPETFSVSSSKCLAWLLYDRLGFPVLLRTDGEAPATSDKALAAMGDTGKSLIKVIDLVTELRYIEACLENVDSAGILRPRFSYGTLTGRLRGGFSGGD